MNILFTVCGRAGSKGVRNKNISLLAGVPLVGYLLALIDCYEQTHSEHHCQVALNTDSPELQQLVLALRPDTFVTMRKPELAGGVVGKVEVIRDTFLQAAANWESDWDLVVDLDITSPIRTCSDLERLIAASTTEYDVVFSVVASRRSPYFNMVKLENGLADVVIAAGYTARQQAPEVFDINAAMYSYRPSFLQSASFLFDGRCYIVPMDDTLVLDIDHPSDLEWLEYLMPRFLERSPELHQVYAAAKSNWEHIGEEVELPGGDR